MIPDTTNQPMVFLEWTPDWAKPVDVAARHETTIVTSNNGVEQRSRRRERARYSVSFVRSALDAASFSLTRAQARRQLASAIVCPIWTDRSTLAVMLNVDRAKLTLATAGTKFKIGHYAYFAQAGTAPTFRKVTGIGVDYLDLHATDASPVPPIPAFTGGASVYPAIVGFRPEASVAFVNLRVAHQEHPVTIEEL